MREGAEAEDAMGRADAAIIHTAERQVGMREMQQRHVDAGATRAGFQHHAVNGALVARIDVKGQRFWVFVNVKNDVAEIAIRDHRQHGAENFLLHYTARQPDMGEQRGRDEFCRRIMLAALGNPGAIGHGVFQQRRDAFGMPWVDDAAIIRAGAGLSEHGRDGAARFLQEGGQHRFMNEEIIGRDAGLAGIQEFTPHNAFRGFANIGRRIQNDRAFAAEFQRDGAEMLCRRRHHDFADRRTAGEEDMVERQVQQRGGDFRPAFEHRDLGGFEYLRDNAAHHGRACGREF